METIKSDDTGPEKHAENVYDNLKQSGSHGILAWAFFGLGTTAKTVQKHGVKHLRQAIQSSMDGAAVCFIADQLSQTMKQSNKAI